MEIKKKDVREKREVGGWSGYERLRGRTQSGRGKGRKWVSFEYRQNKLADSSTGVSKGIKDTSFEKEGSKDRAAKGTGRKGVTGRGGSPRKTLSLLFKRTRKEGNFKNTKQMLGTAEEGREKGGPFEGGGA